VTAEVAGFDAGIVTLRVSGRLTQAELRLAQQQTVSAVGPRGRFNILVLAEHFNGWEEGGQWEDFSFQETHDARIGRMAIVAEERWRDLALLFTSSGLRPFPIEFFPAASLGAARAWLAAGQ